MRNLKRLHGITFTDSNFKDSKVLNAFIYETENNGEIDTYADQENVQWLITKANMENLYSQLKIALGKSN